VQDAIRLQERVGLPVITDGEQRRLSFQGRFAETVSGLGDWELNAFLWGQWSGDSCGIWCKVFTTLHGKWFEQAERAHT
jgi:5-methyltetrahydropteroyltriglutamate--homocysteine methyltransferase